MMDWQTELDKLRRDHRTPLVIAAFLGLLLLFAIGQFAQLFTTAPLKTTSITPVAPKHLQNLADLHLFGVYAASDDLPIAQLPFKLEGTVVFLGAPNLSHALISNGTSFAKVYQVGDRLPGNITISRIAKAYVVLDDNGTLEKLALPIRLLTAG